MLPSGCTNPVAGPVGETIRRLPNESDRPVPTKRHLLPSHRYPCMVVGEVRPLPSTVIFMLVAVSMAGKLTAAFIRMRDEPCRAVVHAWSVTAPLISPPNTYARPPSPTIIGRVLATGTR